MPSRFHELLKPHLSGSNNPTGWQSILGLLEDCGYTVDESVPSAVAMARSAERFVANLYCIVMVSRREHIDLGLDQLVMSTKGKGLGAKLIRWTMTNIGNGRPREFKMVWSGLHPKMSNTLEQLIIHLESYDNISVNYVMDWITKEGGLDKLSSSYMTYKGNLATQKKYLEEENERLADIFRKQKAAEKLGLTVEGYEDKLAAEVQEKRERDTEIRYDLIRKRLIKNGEIIHSPKDSQLLICSKGKLVLISDQDEYELYSGMARI